MSQWPSPCQFEARPTYVGTVDSTMSLARQRALEGAKAGTAIVAEAQTAGRGRDGAHWLSPAGGIYLTVILWPSTRWPLPSLSLALGLALIRLGGHPSGTNLRLKWPNDLLGAHGKVAGLLLEAGQPTSGPSFVLVGLGLNLVAPAAPARGYASAATQPGKFALPASGLAEEGFDDQLRASRSALVDRLLGLFGGAYLAWEAEGFAPLCNAFDAAHAYRGRRAVALCGGPDGQDVVGVVGNVTPSGALILHGDQGEVLLQSASLRLLV